MKTYKNIDTGEMWTFEELQREYTLFEAEMNYDSFDDYLESMLEKGREKIGGLEEV